MPFLDLVAEQYSTKLGSDKGNVTLTSYDGTLRVTVAVGNVISFGPEIQPAQTLIHSCLNRWSEGANSNLKAVVLDAFDVDKQGSMNVGKIPRCGVWRLTMRNGSAACRRFLTACAWM